MITILCKAKNIYIPPFNSMPPSNNFIYNEYGHRITSININNFVQRTYDFLLVYLSVIETNCVLKDNGNGHLQSNYSLHFTSIPTLNTHHFLPRTTFTLLYSYTDREFDFLILGFRNKMVKMLPTFYGATSYYVYLSQLALSLAWYIIMVQHHWIKKTIFFV